MKYQLYLSSLLVAIIMFAGCNRATKTEAQQPDAGFTSYIQAYSTGMLKSGNSLRIVFAGEVLQSVREMPHPEELFDFSPALPGKALWMDNNILEYIPDQRMKNGTAYTASLDLDAVMQTRKGYETFSWEFQIIDQAISVEKQQTKVDDLSENVDVVVQVLTADYAAPSQLEEAFSFKYPYGDVSAEWEHNDKGEKHRLTLKNISRKKDDTELSISWKGKDMGIDVKGDERIIIPGTSVFKVLNVKTYPDPDRYILIEFSDAPDPQYNIDGLIYLKSGVNLNVVRNENRIKAYPVSKTNLEETLVLDASLKNSAGFSLEEDYEMTIHFDPVKPLVRWCGDGVILPDGKQLILPFEAVNLYAVDVSVVQVFEDNLTQFFQDNDIDKTYNLKKVGRLVMKKKVELINDEPIDRNIWNKFSLDLSEIIDADPGALYSVTLDIRPEYSAYPCHDSDNETLGSTIQNTISLEDDPEYIYYDSPDYYYYNDGYYESGWWQNRDNPCHPAYFNNKEITRNVLASNIGIIAKRSDRREVNVFVHDLLSSSPLSGATIKVLNYQQQVIAKAIADRDGYAQLSCAQTPWLVIAESGSQKGYLKITDDESLSLSRFDVSGEASPKGLKAFIYGERGVWRPGDTLYLSTMIADRDNPLPDDHPLLMELFDPQGRITWRQVQKLGNHNLNTFIIPTDNDDITGRWTAKVTVGGASFSKKVRIETIKPNRLSVDIEFPSDTIRGYTNTTIPVFAEYLHGAKASGLKLITEISLKPLQPFFKGYSDYSFYNPAATIGEHHYDEMHKKLDSNGKTELILSPPGVSAPGFLRADFNSRVYENNGEFSVDFSSVVLSPYKTYVGVKAPGETDYWNRLETDKDHKLDVVTLDEHGNPVDVTGIEVFFYKMKWDWWYENGGNYASYVNNRNVQPVYSTRISTKKGKADVTFNIAYNDWGRYLVYVSIPGGHACCSEVFVDWPGWNTRHSDENKQGASLIAVSTDKDKYNVGDKAEITFPGAENGNAVFTIESNNRILYKETVKTHAGDNTLSFKVDADMTPNVYACIHLLQPHYHPDNDLPLRLYGVVPVFADDPETILSPVVDIPDQLRSQENTTITVSEENGKPMTFTLAVVDEGLLGLTNFRTPSPHDHFFAREALGIHTWDMYDDVIGAFSGNMASVFAIGGDEYVENKENKDSRRFKPVVEFYGPYTLKKGKEQKIQMQLPEYVGKVRVMAVAAAENAWGAAHQSVTIKDPLMVHATLPRILGPNEKVRVPVTVFAMEESVKNVEVAVSVTGDVEIKEYRKSVFFNEPGDQIVWFEMLTGNTSGEVTFNVKASSANETAMETITLECRNPNPFQTIVNSVRVKPGMTETIPVTLHGDLASATAIAEVSSIGISGVGRTVEYMMRYPHACAEQTTSAGFVQLLLPGLLNTSDPRFENAQQNVTEIIGGLRKYQKPSGAMAMWPGAQYESPWVSCYIAHFMAVANETGYTVPQATEQKLMRYLQKNNFADFKDDGLTEAYRLYVLALHGDADFSAMNRMKANLSKPAVALRLAAAYAIAGKTDVAEDIFKTINLNGFISEDFSRFSWYYYDRNTAMAMALETAILVDDQNAVSDFSAELSKLLSGNEYMNTHNAAWSMYALWQLLKNEAATNLMSFDMDYNGSSYSQNTDRNIVSYTLPVQTENASVIDFSNKGEQSLFVNTAVTARPEQGREKETQRNLNLDIQYHLQDGSLADPENLNVGDEVIMEVSVTNPGLRKAYDNMALTVGLPAGWEFYGNEDKDFNHPGVDYYDLRDDRINIYFGLKRNEVITFNIRVHASYAGQFYLPATICEAMYDNTIYALKKGQWVSVAP